MSEKKSENFPEFSTVNGKARALIFTKSQKFSKVSALVRVVYKVTKDIVYKVSSVQSHQRQYCSVQCTVYSVQVTKDSALQCTVYSVQSHQRQYCSVQCTKSPKTAHYSVQCSVQSHQRQEFRESLPAGWTAKNLLRLQVDQQKQISKNKDFFFCLFSLQTNKVFQPAEKILFLLISKDKSV